MTVKSALRMVGAAAAPVFWDFGLALENISPRVEKFGRIDRFAVNHDFVMQMGPGAAARGAEDADGMAMRYALALLDQDPAQVAIAGADGEAVVDFDEAAETPFEPA